MKTRLKPLVWEQRNWNDPKTGEVVDSTWHAELPSYQKHQPLYEIRKFDEGYFVWFCATPYRHRLGDDFDELELAKKAAEEDWKKFYRAMTDQS